MPHSVLSANTVVGGITPTTWNPSDKNANITLSNGNLTATWGASNVSLRAIHPIGDGQKLYFELTLDVVNGSWGLAPGSATSDVSLSAGWFDGPRLPYNCCWRKDGFFSYYAVGTTVEVTLAATDIVGVAVTRSGNTIKVYVHKNGTYVIAGDAGSTPNPGAGTNPNATYTLSSNNVMAASSSRDGTGVLTANFGASGFSYSVPSGFESGWGAAV